MLRFILILPDTPSNGDFLLKDLPGSGKRIDILCRSLAVCFDWAPTSWPKSQLEFVAVLSNEIVITFNDPSEALPVGEVEWAKVIKSTLRGEPQTFTSVREIELDDLVSQILESDNSLVWVLDEEGIPMSSDTNLDLSAQNSFMLGNHRGFNSYAQEVIQRFGIPRVSLGTRSYLGSHCVAAMIALFERLIKQ